MLGIKSKTSLRLILGFLFITLIIVVTTFFAFLYNAKKADQALSEITEKGERINRVLFSAFHIREKHEYQAHLIMSRDFSHVKQFDEAVKKTNEWLNRLDSELKGTKERDIFNKLTEANRLFDKLFYKEIISAVKSGEETRILMVHEKSENARAQIILWNNRLIDLIKEEIDQTIERASMVREKAIKATIIAISLTTLFAVFIGLNVSLSIMKPIQALTKGTEYISRGDFTKKIDLSRSDEFGRLADSFNRMTDKLREHQEKLVQSEKLASLGQLGAGVAHEINNPLGVILGYVKVMLKDKDETDKDYEDLKVIEEEAKQCKNIVEDLLALSRPVKLSRESVDLGEVIDDELGKIANRHKGEPIETIREIDDVPLILFSEKNRIKQVISNILSNSVEAMADGGTIRLRAFLNSEPTIDSFDTLDDAFGPHVENFLIMEFSDTGCGIPEGNMKKVFDPFFTTKEDGTGLGLSIIYGIIKAHNGLIDVKSTVGKGTTFIVNIPVLKTDNAQWSEHAST
jgi:signal transduction histidine kinase